MVGNDHPRDHEASEETRNAGPMPEGITGWSIDLGLGPSRV